MGRQKRRACYCTSAFRLWWKVSHYFSEFCETSKLGLLEWKITFPGINSNI